MSLSKLGPLALCLLMLGGCSTKGLSVTRTDTVALVPPSALMADCPETSFPEVKTNGDLLELAIARELDLAECNRSKARLREWVEAERSK